MNSTRVAVDVAKSVFQVAVSSVPGRVDEQHRLSRERFHRFFAGRRPLLNRIQEVSGPSARDSVPQALLLNIVEHNGKGPQQAIDFP